MLVTLASGCQDKYSLDFFPADVGRTWSYEITLGDVQPLYYREMAWVLGSKIINNTARGALSVVSYTQPKKRLQLVMRTKGNAAKQGPLQYKNGVEVEILRDDLGVFRGAKQIFWVGAGGDVSPFTVDLVVTYDPRSPDAPVTGSMWGSAGQRDGYEVRLVCFFGTPADTEMSRIMRGNVESRETLRFVGVDTNVEGYRGQELLHFIRSVKKSEEKESEIDAAFTEDMWYARGSGLVRVVQKVGAKVSMTWVLRTMTR